MEAEHSADHRRFWSTRERKEGVSRAELPRPRRTPPSQDASRRRPGLSRQVFAGGRPHGPLGRTIAQRISFGLPAARSTSGGLRSGEHAAVVLHETASRPDGASIALDEVHVLGLRGGQVTELWDLPEDSRPTTTSSTASRPSLLGPRRCSRWRTVRVGGQPGQTMRLQLAVGVEAEAAAVAADAALLEAAERRLVVALRGVDPDVAGAQLLGDAEARASVSPLKT